VAANHGGRGEELLVEFYFFPTFLRYFKGYARLRTFAATVMAASVGNMIHHFVRYIHYVPQLGLARAVAGYETYAFYCAVLGIGIGLSQMRQRKKRPNQGWIRGQLVPSFGVALFFCVLHIFDDAGRTYTLRDHFRFLFHLFGGAGWI